ncbi:hypothetical protein OG21DRAFT_1247616 [Imleria badia]|nr:hypothetical protein OG21DRAFT_1247616 [Imleria badia]
MTIQSSRTFSGASPVPGRLREAWALSSHKILVVLQPDGTDEPVQPDETLFAEQGIALRDAQRRGERGELARCDVASGGGRGAKLGRDMIKCVAEQRCRRASGCSVFPQRLQHSWKRDWRTACCTRPTISSLSSLVLLAALAAEPST